MVYDVLVLISAGLEFNHMELECGTGLGKLESFSSSLKWVTHLPLRLEENSSPPSRRFIIMVR